jgi:hypothetical protein
VNEAGKGLAPGIGTRSEKVCAIASQKTRR